MDIGAIRSRGSRATPISGGRLTLLRVLIGGTVAVIRKTSAGTGLQSLAEANGNVPISGFGPWHCHRYDSNDTIHGIVQSTAGQAEL